MFLQNWADAFDANKLSLLGYLQDLDEDDDTVLGRVLATVDSMDATMAALLDDPPASLPEANSNNEMGLLSVYQNQVWDDFETFDCAICFESVQSEAEAFRLAGCHHVCCRECAIDLVETAIRAATVLSLKCPQPQCGCEFPPQQVQTLLSDESWDRFQELAFLAALSKDSSVHWCPRAGCGNAVSVEPGRRHVECSLCGIVSCVQCGAESHQGSCKDYATWLADQPSAEGLAAKWKMERTKPCPKCKAPIERLGGCNHFTCPACDYQFCFLCMRRYTDGHYDRMNLAGCPGQQFTDPSEFSTGKRVRFRILCVAGIVVAIPVVAALAVPVALVGGSIFCVTRLHRANKKRIRIRKYGF